MCSFVRCRPSASGSRDLATAMRGGRGEEDGQMEGLGEENKDKMTAVENAEWKKKHKTMR